MTDRKAFHAIRLYQLLCVLAVREARNWRASTGGISGQPDNNKQCVRVSLPT